MKEKSEFEKRTAEKQVSLLTEGKQISKVASKRYMV